MFEMIAKIGEKIINFGIAVSLTVVITLTIKLTINGKIDLNKIFCELQNSYLSKKYNKKANDYNKLFPYFHSSLINSPFGEIVQFLLTNCNATLYYPDYKKKKIFVLKNGEKRKMKLNKFYATELKNSTLRSGTAPALEEKDKFRNADYYCHRCLSKGFKYFLELNELFEKNYTFQKLVYAKWYNESKQVQDTKT
jgi:hypothetical protein